nr:hypothetical protein [Rhodococcus sp. (in: high G+C Gram-positive bacteria)]
MSTYEHSHCWNTSSRHSTSEGIISYQHCRCGSQRITATTDPAQGTLALMDRTRS